MKKMLNLTGIKKLTKKDQKQIKGSSGQPSVYCGPPRMCCVMVYGIEWCDFGYCQDFGRCIWA